MCEQIISRDVITQQARRAADADFKTGNTQPDCPYLSGTTSAKQWYAAYLVREVELSEAGIQRVVSTFAAGPVEQLEAVPS